jgi:hypothetical protein
LGSTNGSNVATWAATDHDHIKLFAHKLLSNFSD